MLQPDKQRFEDVFVIQLQPLKDLKIIYSFQNPNRSRVMYATFYLYRHQKFLILVSFD